MIKFPRCEQIKIMHSQRDIELLVSCKKNNMASRFDEYIIMVELQYTDSSGVIYCDKDPVKVEIVVPTSAWNLEALYIYFIDKIRIFQRPLIQMPLFINDENELIRHFVKWRLEHGI